VFDTNSCNPIASAEEVDCIVVDIAADMVVENETVLDKMLVDIVLELMVAGKEVDILDIVVDTDKEVGWAAN
jgi:hypothetical protein